MLSNLKRDHKEIKERRAKKIEYSTKADKVFWLVGTIYGRRQEHHLIFLSEDGEIRYYTIDNVYPYFYVTGYSEQSVVDLIKSHGKWKYVKGVEVVSMMDPITRVREPVVKVIVWSPNYVTNRKNPTESVSLIFPEESVHNNHVQYFHVILNETGFVMGMPYIFKTVEVYDERRDRMKKDTVPVPVETVSEKDRRLYEEVFGVIDDTARDVGEQSFSILHGELPPLHKMIIVVDIEVQANHGESMNPELAEVPITSISATTYLGTAVFTLTNEVLGIEPPDNPEAFEDGSFLRRVYRSEVELLDAALGYIDGQRQKIVVTYNGDRFDIPYISRRLELLGMHKKYEIFGWEMKHAYSESAWKKRWYKKWKGKFLVDLYEYFANANVKSGAYRSEYQNLKLDTIAKTILDRGKYEYEGRIEELSSEELAFYNAKDTQLTFDLATHDDNFPAFILFFIMRFGNLSLDNANRRGVTSWWGGFLFRYMNEREILYPNDSQLVRHSTEKLKGGTVLDAKTGVYDDVTVIDFSSLYPTMIILWNICFSTIDCDHDDCSADREDAQTIEIPGTTITTCKHYRGYMSAAMDFLRNARVMIYKPRADKSHPEYDIFYYFISQFFKIFMNAGYGCLANYGFPFAHDYAAQAVTATSREKLKELVYHTRQLGGEVIYGDSVLGSEAVMVKFGRDGKPMLLPFSSLWHMLREMFEVEDYGDKERITVSSTYVWSHSGWNRVNAIIRHYIYKTVYRVSDGLGSVDITEDHSLVDDSGKMFRPEEVKTKGKVPVSGSFPLEGRNEDRLGYELLMFLFSMAGTAAGRSNTGYKSQRSVMIQIKENAAEKGRQLLELCHPIIEQLGADYNTYTTSMNKLLIKFTSHDKLWDEVRDTLYKDDEKLKPYPYIFNLSGERLELIYEFLKDFYYNEERDKKTKTIHDRWTVRSSTEFIMFSTLAEHFEPGAYTFMPQYRGKVYHIKKRDEVDRKVTTTIVKNPDRMVYDLDTRDGTFYANNILCHNTDSIFGVDVGEDFAVTLTNLLGVEVEDEGTFEKFILYLKKNYIKISRDKKTVMGMSGKKRNNCQLVRDAFKETVDGLSVDMNREEMLDYVYSQIRKYEEKLRSYEFNRESVQLTQSLSKDIQYYKSNTPLVQAIRNMMRALETKGLKTRNLGRRGVIADYVRVRDTRRWMPSQMVEIDEIDVEHYINQLYNVFSQLTIPLSKKTTEHLIESKEQTGLGEWY